MRLIYLSPVPWESFAQRPHKFVEWFHARTAGTVLWIDPYPTRFPNWKDLQRLRLTHSTCQTSGIPSWLTILRPGGLPIEPMPGSGRVNERLWQRHWQQISDFANQTSTLLAIGKPSVFALRLLGLLHHCSSFYDAMDNFPAFYAGVSRFALARRERQIAQQVDIIWASSSQLKSRWEHFHKDVRLVHNGLDLSAINEVISVANSSDRKIFGYIGTIASWFDWSWICALAKARPKDEIRLIGPVFEQSAVKLPDNIKLLPACDHAAALKAIMQFHVGLIPFKINALTASVDPIKYYEYRALGLPVISTNFGEMGLRICERGVFITKSLSDIPALTESAIQFNRDADEAFSFILQNSWQARFDAAGLLP